MKRTTKILIILLSIIILIGGMLWGGYKYLIYSDQYPFVEFSKIKRLIPDDPENAASRYLKLVQKLEKKKNTERYKDKQVDYIVNYIEVLAITECKDSVITEMAFLNKLWENGNAETKQMVKPFIYYQKVNNANSISEAKSAAKKFIEIIQESAQFENRTERFALLICNALDSICPNEPIRDSLYNSIKSNLINTKFNEEYKQMWQQFLLSYCYYLEYKDLKKSNSDSDTLQYLLSKITETLPVKFYTNFEFEEKALGISHNDLVLTHVNYYLKSGNKDEAYQVLSELVLKNPFKYFDLYNSIYRQIEGSQFTDEQWFRALKKFMPMVPNVQYTSLSGDILDLSEERDKWLLLDFWGTWCPPCIKQLPEIQAFYEKNRNVIDVFTVSSNSDDLENFLSKNKYSFPVADLESIEGFEINEFPTKILISPYGSYVKVPNIIEWVNYVRKITRLDEIK